MFKQSTFAMLLAVAKAAHLSKEPVELAQVQWEANAGDEWDILGTDTCADIEGVLEILGASAHSSWTTQADNSKRNMWKYFELLNQKVSGLSSDSASQIVTLNLSIDAIATLTNQTVVNSFQTLTDNGNLTLKTMYDQADENYDGMLKVMEELMNRVKFIGERMAMIEKGLGSGYVADAGKIFDSTPLP